MDEEGAEGEDGGRWFARDGTGGDANVAETCLNWECGSGDSFLDSEAPGDSVLEGVETVAEGEDGGEDDNKDEDDDDDEEDNVCPAKWRRVVTCGTSTDFVNGLAVLGE